MAKVKTAPLVQIYERKTKAGVSFYLHYTINGEQVRENTHLRLSGNKEGDKVVIKAVQMLQAERTSDILSGRTGISQATQKNKILLLDYCRKVKESHSNGNSNTEIAIHTALQVVEQVISKVAPKVSLYNTDKKVCESVRDHIQQLPYKAGTQKAYYMRFVWLVGQAVKEGLIKTNPTNQVQGITAESAERVYLLENEIKAFAGVEVKTEAQQQLKEAFLFSCFTGLRFSDVSRLTPEHVEVLEDGRLRLKIETKKTKKYISFVLSNDSAEIIKRRLQVSNGGLLFDLPTLVHINVMLKVLCEKCGIDKAVSFHTARHTFATLLLTKGADVYSVSSLLGHSNINTTQIYAKIIDKKKDETINLIDNVL